MCVCVCICNMSSAGIVLHKSSSMTDNINKILSHVSDGGGGGGGLRGVTKKKLLILFFVCVWVHPLNKLKSEFYSP